MQSLIRRFGEEVRGNRVEDEEAQQHISDRACTVPVGHLGDPEVRSPIQRNERIPLGLMDMTGSLATPKLL